MPPHVQQKSCTVPAADCVVTARDPQNQIKMVGHPTAWNLDGLRWLGTEVVTSFPSLSSEAQGG